MTIFDLDFAKRDYFALFGLPAAFAVDTAELERLYREVQARVHPDKHAHLSDADKRLAMQWATRANEAYQTLKNPLTRARYLLELAGFDARIETNTAMPAEFLMHQMELREAVAQARDAGDDDALDRLHRSQREQIKSEYGDLGAALDRRDYVAAAERVRRLMFEEKLLAEIDDALAALDA